MTSRTVLVVAAPGDPFAAELVRLLKADGVVVLASQEAEEATSIARSRRPALVVLDAVVPDGNGIALCRRLKTDPATSAIPVYCFSTLMARDRCLEAGADGFMLKPTEQEALLRAIHDTLESRVRLLRRAPR